MRFPKTIIYTSHSYIFVSAISNVFHEKDECYVSIDDKTSLSIVQPSKIFPFENTCQVLFVPWYANRWNIGQLKRKLIRNSNRNQIFHLDPFSKFFQNPGTKFSSLPFPEESFFIKWNLLCWAQCDVASMKQSDIEYSGLEHILQLPEVHSTNETVTKISYTISSWFPSVLLIKAKHSRWLWL